MSRTILFSGGGSIGHIAPAVAVWEALKEKDSSIQPVFVTSTRAEERAFLDALQLPWHAIHAGKFPDGQSLRFLTFPFLFIVSCIESFIILLRTKPRAVLSKGGYVSVPLCLMAWMFRIPIVLHESDSVMGRANRLISKLARVVCVGFPSEVGSDEWIVDSKKKEATHYSPVRTAWTGGLPTTHSVFTGNPIRPEITRGSRDAGMRITRFSGNRPVLMIIGGSQGSQALNEAVAKQFDRLISCCDIIHITGRGKKIDRTPHARYWSREFVIDELPHVYALADIAVTRAGAGVLCELAACKKAVIAVPLPAVARDHQHNNAALLADRSAVILLPQDELSQLSNVVRTLVETPKKRAELAANVHQCFPRNAAATIADVLYRYSVP